MAGRHARQAEQRQARREVQQTRVGGDAARRRGRRARQDPAPRSRARSRRHSSACQAHAGGQRRAHGVEILAARPGGEHRGAVQGVAVKQAGQVAHRGQPAALAGGAHRVRRCGAGAQIARRASPARARAAHSSTTASSGHTERSGSHGSSAGSIPDAAATASVTSRCGEGNSTLAQIPSARPGRAPSTEDIRCVSQRSIPRVGTATTSGANGSAGRQRESSASASARASARTARWIVEHGFRGYPGARQAPHGSRSGHDSANSLCQLLAFRAQRELPCARILIGVTSMTSTFDISLPPRRRTRSAPASACGRTAWIAAARVRAAQTC